MQVAAELVKNGEVSLLHWWIYAITIMAVLFTSAVSLAKPMRIAAKVSPIEAMRYQGLEKRGKKVRKGYQNLTIFRLTKANMARNKKEDWDYDCYIRSNWYSVHGCGNYFILRGTERNCKKGY